MQRKVPLSVFLLSLILSLQSLCLQHHHQSSDQSVAEWPTGLQRETTDLLRAYYVLGPKSFVEPNTFIENRFCALCLK